MNIAKRAIAFALASVFTFGTLAFAAEDSVTITQRDSYIDENGNGNLRFITEVKLAAEKVVERFGTWIVPKDLFNGWDKETGENKVLTVENNKDYMITSTDENGKQTGYFTTDIMGIPADLCGEEFYAKSFVVYQENGESVWKQAPLASDNVRRSEQQKEDNAGETDKMYIPQYYHSADNTHTNVNNEVNADINRSTAKFITKFVNNDKYLYRVGNVNTVSLSSLFRREGTPITPTVTVRNIAGDAGVSGDTTRTYTAATWENSSIQFTGTGIVEVTISEANANAPIFEACSLLLEVVDAVNATTAKSATANSVVLLNDVGFSAVTVSNGYAIYGNGFTMTSSSDIPGRYMSYGYVTLDNGTLDNVQVICPNFSQQFLYTYDNEYKNSVRTDGTYPNSRCGVTMSGSSKILNSYVSGGRAAVYVTGVDQQIINSTINGGALANIHISSANSLLLRDVTTIQVPTQATVNDTSKTLLGLGVITVCEEDGKATPITLEGTLKQYNWAKSSYSTYVPSAARFILTSALSQNSYVHNFDGSDWVDLGFAYLPFEAGKPTSISITDNRTDKSDRPYDSVSISGGKVYSYKNTNGTDEGLKTKPEFTPNAYDFVAPHISFNGTSSLCTYNNGTKTLAVKLDDNNPSYTFNFSDVTVSKNGDIPYEIYENGTKVTDSTVLLSSSATKKYTLKFDDTEFYDKDGQQIVQTIHYEYPFTVAVSLTSLPAPTSLAPSTRDALVVASSYNGTWNLATPALNGIKVKAWNSELDDWEEIDLSVFCPSTSGQQSTDKTITLTSNKGTLTVTAPDKFQDGNSIYGKPVVVEDELYFVPTSASKGLVNYKEANGVRTVKLDYTFTDTNNKSCLFSISFSGGGYNHGQTQYSYDDFVKGTKTELTASGGGGGTGCVAKGTMITLADGSKKPIEDITKDDVVIARNFFTGEYATTKPMLVIHHGDNFYDVLTLSFKDGTNIDVIGEHGFYDMDENKFVYFNTQNAGEYVGHRFVKTDGEITGSITLTGYKVENRYTGSYSLVTPVYFNFVAEDLLNVTPTLKIFDVFKYDEGLKYNAASMKADTDKYGTYTYEDFKDYLTYEQYVALNAPYFKVPVEKGVTTFDELIHLINTFVAGDGN